MLRGGRRRNLQINRARSKPSFSFRDYIAKRDYVGATAILEWSASEQEEDCLTEVERLLWIGYCSFRLGNYNRSKEVYIELLSCKNEDVPKETCLYLACCYFYLQMFIEAEEAAMSLDDDSELKNRVLLHIARKTDDETKVAKYRQKLHDSKEDKLSAAAIAFSFRNRFQESADVYKRILVDNPNDLALNVYVAQCYFKLVGLLFGNNAFDVRCQAVLRADLRNLKNLIMPIFSQDYYDVSLEVLSIYCQVSLYSFSHEFDRIIETSTSS